MSACCILLCTHRFGVLGDGGSSMGVSMRLGGGVLGLVGWVVRYGLVIILLAFALTTVCV